MARKPEARIGQGGRLVVLLIYVGLLLFFNWLAFSHILPSMSDKGFWFYVGMLSILLGSQFISPFYVTPGDAFTCAIPGLATIMTVHNWPNWEIGEKIIFVVAVVYCAMVAFAAVISIFTKDSASPHAQQTSQICRLFCDRFGQTRFVYLAIMVFAIYAYHRTSPRELMAIGLATGIVIVLRPVESIWEFAVDLRERLGDIPRLAAMGEVVAYQTPGLVLIRQNIAQRIPRVPLLIRDTHSPIKTVMALDYVGHDEGLLMRALEVQGLLPEPEIAKLSSALPEHGVGRLDLDTETLALSKEFQRHGDLVGIVAQDTTVERLYFEIIRDDDIEEGRLVEVQVGARTVLYQIIDGLTREDAVQQKNTYGYARGQAQKIGMWDENKKVFRHVAWLPRPNAPVYLRKSEEFTPIAGAVGHFPGTNYTASIKNINELVTHNTAILGILGVGKTMLAIELIERMIVAGIKVVCLDLTNQYATELADFYDAANEEKCLAVIAAAGQKDRDSWADDPEAGGSLPNLTQAVDADLAKFMASPGANLKIYNPASLSATKQTSEPKSYKVDQDWNRGASLWSVTPVEITAIISNSLLALVQKQGMTTDGSARVCLVYEEAHSLVPEWSSAVAEGDKAATNASARAILQGRKFGLGCLLITQRTANVTKTILNQCNTIFAMRSFDETGKNFLADYIGKDYSSKLSLLDERQAVFFGKASSCENPVLIRLNDREKFLEVFQAEHPVPEKPPVVEESPPQVDEQIPPDDDEIPF